MRAYPSQPVCLLFSSALLFCGTGLRLQRHVLLGWGSMSLNRIMVRISEEPPCSHRRTVLFFMVNHSDTTIGHVLDLDAALQAGALASQGHRLEQQLTDMSRKN